MIGVGSPAVKEGLSLELIVTIRIALPHGQASDSLFNGAAETPDSYEPYRHPYRHVRTN